DLFLRRSATGQDNHRPPSADRGLWPACPLVLFSSHNMLFSKQSYLGSWDNPSFSTRMISAEPHVPFGFLFLQSQWVIAPVIRLTSRSVRAPCAIASSISSLVTSSQ